LRKVSAAILGLAVLGIVLILIGYVSPCTLENSPFGMFQAGRCTSILVETYTGVAILVISIILLFLIKQESPDSSAAKPATEDSQDKLDK